MASRPTGLLAYVLLVLGAAGVALALLLARSPTEPSLQPVESEPQPRSATPTPKLFAASSVWNAALPADSAVDRDSKALVAQLLREIHREQQAATGPYIATVQASTPLYTVGRDQRRIRVTLDDAGTPGRSALARALRSVPIPHNARPAAGSDGHLVVWQPSTDTMWELFEAVHREDGWHAGWGGAMRRVSGNPGYYTPAAWPEAAYTWGATATSLPVAAGTVLASELRAGRIAHALAVSLPAPRAGAFAWPAQRSDGTGGPDEIPEGAHLRLDPQLDLASLHLPRLTLMLATAAQRYGMVVRDQTHHAVGLYFQDPTPLGRNAYGAVFGGLTPNQVLAEFPWDKLEVLRMHLCTHAPCRAPAEQRAGKRRALRSLGKEKVTPRVKAAAPADVVEAP